MVENPSSHSRGAWILITLSAIVVLTAASFLVFYLNCRKILQTHLTSQAFQIPSTVYADAPMLRVGEAYSPAGLVGYLKRLEYRRSQKVSRGGEYAVSGNTISFRRRHLFLTRHDYPVVSVQFRSGVITKLEEDTGASVASYRLDPLPIRYLSTNEWEKRRLVFFDDIPEALIHAVIAIEDHRFFDHHGVDLQAIMRAGWKNLNEKNQLQGGSTITQQLVKNFYLTPERSLRRKLSEAMLAWMIENRLSKQQILELYLNEIYLGQRGSISIHGVGEASWFYFDTDLDYITVAQAALLAGMIQAPSIYNPFRHPKEALQRRDAVLNAMVKQNFMTQKDYEQYSQEPLGVRHSQERPEPAPYFADLVKVQLLQKFSEKTVYQQNLHVFTTIDLEMQQIAEDAVERGLETIDQVRYGKVHKNAQGCLIAIEPKTGYVRALVGGRNYSKSQFNRIVRASRQPGSIFKPIVYSAAIEQSFLIPNRRQRRNFTPATILKDEPWILRYSNGTWQPQNYDHQYYGDVTLRSALAYSLNIPTARLAVDIGLDNVAGLAKKFGFERTQALPSIALGAFQASPWDVAEAYQVLANSGTKISLRTVRRVADAQGMLIDRNAPAEQRVLHTQSAYLITNMLQSVMTQGTAARTRSLGFFRPAAGKTGTTDDYRDAWFAGYTPDLLCVVWTGYDDNTPLEMNGAEAALPIWADFMTRATADTPQHDFAVPLGILKRVVDPETGELATSSCPNVITELFIAGTEPQVPCHIHSGYTNWVYYDSPPHPSPRSIHGRRTGWWKKFKRSLKFW